MWDIWPRDSRKKLRRFLMRHLDEFRAEGLSGLDNILDAIHDQVCEKLFKSPLSITRYVDSLP